jgi:colanic acid biosynthesis glycosyl transferase WcaI
MVAHVRIAVCDNSGHPFQVQLTRELARRGHDALHLHFSEFQSPKGRLKVESGDPKTLAIEGVSLGVPFAKYSFIKRRTQERKIGRKIADRIEAFTPEVVLGCNLSIDVLGQVLSRSRAKKWPFVLWQQDIYSHAITSIFTKKYGFLGRLIGDYYRWQEKKAVRQSAAVVVISEDFVRTLEHDFGLTPKIIHVIENWAPVDEITPQPKDNSWSRAHRLANKDVIMYTGTIGLKHDPSQILKLAAVVNDRPNTAIMVISEGPAADWLASEAKNAKLDVLQVLSFQSFEVYPEVLGTADILISILEADAGVFSVPSKILSYLCAGRPIVLCAPLENLASRTVQKANAGLAVPAGDQAAFVSAVLGFLNDSNARETCARNARAYAERTFNIGPIADRFETVLQAVKCN